MKNKATVWMFEAIEHVIRQFPVLGINSDNGSEFINHYLFAFCERKPITFTRSRQGNKNDRGHVEQRPWKHGREFVGYLRLGTQAELDLLNAIGERDQRFTNYLLTLQKLIAKQRDGDKITKRHEAAQPPCARVLADERLTTVVKRSLRAKRPRPIRGPSIGRSEPSRTSLRPWR